MNNKIKYAIPVFAAVFVLTFAFATPHIMADSVDMNSEEYSTEAGDQRTWKNGYHGHKTILVEEFVGSIPIPEERNNETYQLLREQMTVSLGQAVSVAESEGITDAIKASVGIVKDGEDNRYVVWKIVSMAMDTESETKTMNFFVVDAGNLENFAAVTKTFDHSGMNGKMCGDKNRDSSYAQG